MSSAYRIPRGDERAASAFALSAMPAAAGILARDNIPVLGWLLLRGRCRGCRCADPRGLRRG